MKYLRKFSNIDEFKQYIRSGIKYIPNVSIVSGNTDAFFIDNNMRTIISIETRLLNCIETNLIVWSNNINERVRNVESVILEVCETDLIDPTLSIELRINNIETVLQTILTE